MSCMSYMVEIQGVYGCRVCSISITRCEANVGYVLACLYMSCMGLDLGCLYKYSQ